MLVRLFDGFIKNIEKVYVLISTLTFVAILIVNVVDILLRFFSGRSIVAAQELSILCFSWTVFLGMAVVLKRNLDPKITIFLDYLVPKKHHRYFEIVVNALIIIFVVSVLLVMIDYVQLQSMREANYLPINYMYFSLPIIFSFSFIFLFISRNFISVLKRGE